MEQQRNNKAVQQQQQQEEIEEIQHGPFPVEQLQVLSLCLEDQYWFLDSFSHSEFLFFFFSLNVGSSGFYFNLMKWVFFFEVLLNFSFLAWFLPIGNCFLLFNYLILFFFLIGISDQYSCLKN